MLERLRLGGFSGTYKLRNAELARERRHQTIPVTVLFLDDTARTFQVEKRGKGSNLLDQVFQYLELSEKDYFGLQFTQQKDNVIRWLDPNKSFKKQWNSIIEGDTNPPFQFRVKFYVADPSRLLEEYTRYHFYLQVKRDILKGKLSCPLNTACLLASYTVQSELGDYHPIDHYNGYLSSMQLLNEQNEEIERRISELHKLHRGQLPADAEYNYLEHAKKLYMYGVDLHKATDVTGKEIQLGVTSIGLVVLQNNIRINVFSWSKIIKLSFKRKEFCIHLKRELSENYDTQLCFGMKSHKNAKTLWKSCVEHHSFFRLERPNRLPNRFLPLSLGSRFYYSGRTELQTVQESKQRGKISKIFTRSPSKRLFTPRLPTQLQQQTNGNVNDNNGNKNQTTSSSLLTITKAYRTHDNKVTSKQSDSLPRKAWEQQSDDDGGFIDRCSKTYDKQYRPSPLDLPLLNGINKIDQQYEENLVTIKLMADEQGRFGFNVRGGADLKLPVLVTRVASQTPADRTIPRICEGDQVIRINGNDVNELTHIEVVSLIKASKELHAGELVLTIKQNALIDFPEDEPILKYVPENENEFPSLSGDDLFSQSLLLLSDGLASGSLMNQYEKLYRKNINLVISEAKKTENLNKNRYRDISPYDCTRVILIKSDTGDYINANYVNMELPSGTINRYIATQGPLDITTTDFWRMVQQESSHLVVMLTTVMERGRPKCHQYWPVAGDVLQMTPTFSVKCLSEIADETGSFVFRDLQLCDTISEEKRAIHHMQYLAWPDHGVPSDPNLFIEFTEKVRAARKKSLLEEIDDSLKNFKCLRDVDADATETKIDNDTDVKNDGNDDVVDIDDDNENSTASDDKLETKKIEDSSPEEINLPPSTSIHQYISAANPPIIVHCSAGIGRTGVLILMDTALSLMETREPIYPLDIVQSMRDQRACMIQNVSQYRFVCQCICAAFAKMSKKETTPTTKIS